MQELISHIATTHVRAIAQGVTESVQVMHTLTDLYDRWRTRLHSLMSEAKPKSAAASKHPFPSSSFRSQQHSMMMPPPGDSASSGGSDKAIPEIIPKGIPKMGTQHADLLKQSSSTAGEAAMSAEQIMQDVAANQQDLSLGFWSLQNPGNDQAEDYDAAKEFYGGSLALRENNLEGFLKVIDEDHDNLVIQRELEAEEEEGANATTGESL